MSKGTVNKVILVGNLGQDPVIKVGKTEVKIASLSIATTESWKDKNGENKEVTEWHKVLLFAKMADIADEWLERGCKVYIEGRLQTRKWEKDGQTHYTTEIIGEKLQILEFKSKSKSSDAEKEEKLTTMAQRNREMQVADAGLNDDIPF